MAFSGFLLFLFVEAYSLFVIDVVSYAGAGMFRPVLDQPLWQRV